jgi:hypothetical protein
MIEQKVREWRPEDCGTRVGDEVMIDEKLYLKVKCRRCSKRDGVDQFHYIELAIKSSV